jgi:hypothetical protein
LASAGQPLRRLQGIIGELAPVAAGSNGRFTNLLAYLDEAAPDIDGLQESKAPDDKFSAAAIRAVGYGALWNRLNMAGRSTRSSGRNGARRTRYIRSDLSVPWPMAGGRRRRTDREYRRTAFKYLRLVFDGDVLIGATSLGLTEHVGVIRGLIQSRTRLGHWKARLMEDPMQVMAAYLAAAQDAA